MPCVVTPMWQDQNLAWHTRVERAIRVRDAIQRQSSGDVADERPRGRECERFRDECPHLFGSNHTCPRTVFRDEDRSRLHQLAQVDVGKRARELSIVHEATARLHAASCLSNPRAIPFEHC